MLRFANLQSFIEEKPGGKEDVAKGVCFPLCLFVDLAGHPWSLPFAARCVSVASARPQPQQQQQRPPERKAGGGFMDVGSRSSGGAGFDDDDGLAARREVSSTLKELSVRVETKGGSCSGSAGTDQLPNTPRSKHSATEQRRRSKINDRSVAIAPDLIQKWLAVLFLSFDCLRVLDV